MCERDFPTLLRSTLVANIMQCAAHKLWQYSFQGSCPVYVFSTPSPLALGQVAINHSLRFGPRAQKAAPLAILDGVVSARQKEEHRRRV